MWVNGTLGFRPLISKVIQAHAGQAQAATGQAAARSDVPAQYQRRRSTKYPELSR
jgi:hypothetical protein